MNQASQLDSLSVHNRPPETFRRIPVRTTMILFDSGNRSVSSAHCLILGGLWADKNLHVTERQTLRRRQHRLFILGSGLKSGKEWCGGTRSRERERKGGRTMKRRSSCQVGIHFYFCCSKTAGRRRGGGGGGEEEKGGKSSWQTLNLSQYFFITQNMWVAQVRPSLFPRFCVEGFSRLWASAHTSPFFSLSSSKSH